MIRLKLKVDHDAERVHGVAGGLNDIEGRLAGMAPVGIAVNEYKSWRRERRHEALARITGLSNEMELYDE